MPKSYLTNPVTEELIKEGIIVSYEQVERELLDRKMVNSMKR